jgi:hypothetical protein
VDIIKKEWKQDGNPGGQARLEINQRRKAGQARKVIWKGIQIK